MYMQIYTWSEQVYIYTGCIFAHVQINFYIYAIAFTCPKIHPGANYTYMYNIHPVCKSAHVNGAYVDFNACFFAETFQPMNAVLTFQIDVNDWARAIRGKFTFAGAWESFQ